MGWRGVCGALARTKKEDTGDVAAIRGILGPFRFLGVLDINHDKLAGQLRNFVRFSHLGLEGCTVIEQENQ